ncbi:MAG: Zn-ribbon domain-containing OB-fold protein [Candidatus Methanofastidiosia archaeon]
MKEFRGTPLKAEEFKKTIGTYWKPNLWYSWSCGVAVSRFLQELKNGRLVGRKCRMCGRILIPPRMFCELCFRETDKWVYLKDTGHVNTYAISYIAYDASRIKEPVIPAVIEIDGASKDMGILHLLGEVEPEDVEIGMRVKALFKPADERKASITDIKYFKPLEVGK